MMLKKVIFYLKKYQLYIEFFIIALFILYPVLKNGYVLLLDSVFTPRMSWNFNSQIETVVYRTFLTLLTKIFGGIIFEKIIFLAIIMTSLMGAYNLPKTNNLWVRYFAAFLYLFNPFVYSRFVSGQLGVLLAYSLLPFLFRYFIDFMQDFSRKKIFKVLLVMIIIGFIELKFILFMFVGLGVLSIFNFLFNINNKKYLKKFVKNNVKIIIFFIALNIFWLIPMFFGRSDFSQLIINKIDRSHLSAFRTVSDEQHGVLWNTAAMYGFWGDREGRYAVQKDIIPYWFELYVVILAIVIWGAFLGLKQKQKRSSTISFIVIGVVSLVLAVGIAYPSFELLVLWLNNNITFYNGYREPQKWVAMLILSYVYLGSIGVEDLIIRIKKIIKKSEIKFDNKKIRFVLNKLHQIIPAFFIIIPLLYSPGILKGFRGQLYISNYPDSWFEVNNLLNKDKEDFRVLFLPWHQYMSFKFAGRIINNPAVNFFKKPILAGDNMEMGSIYSQTNNPTSLYIEKEILAKKESIRNIGEKLMSLNIKYIIFAKESDYFNYEFIYKQSDLEKIYEKDRMMIYQNLKWVE